MMKCPYCQTDLADDAKFCYNCGNKVNQEEVVQNNDIEEEKIEEQKTYKELEEDYQQKYFDKHAKIVVPLLIVGIVAGCIGGDFKGIYTELSVLGFLFYGFKYFWNRNKDIAKKVPAQAKFSIVFSMLLLCLITSGIKGCFFDSDKSSEVKKDSAPVTEVKKEDAGEKKATENIAPKQSTATEDKKETKLEVEWLMLSGHMYNGVWVYEGDPKKNDLERFGQITQIDTENGRVQFYRPVSKTYQWFERDNLRRYGALYIKSDDPAYLKVMGKK